MRHTKHSTILAQLINGRLHFGLGLGVQRCSSLIENENRGVAYERTRDG